MKKIVGIESLPYEEAIGRDYKYYEKIDTKNKKRAMEMYGKQMPSYTDNFKYAYVSDNHNFSENNIGNLKSDSNTESEFDITQYHKCNENLYWEGCYDSDNYYKKFVTKESNAHPAKISFKLTNRILKHLENLGLLKKGMTVLDFMAGSFRISLMASLKGYNSIGIELEPHFIKMGEDNKKRAELVAGRKLSMQIIQGDSRQLSTILNKESVGIISPPYGLGEGIGHSGQPTQVVKDLNLEVRYGSSDGNIGNLPYKEIIGVVSPPYQDTINSKNELQEIQARYERVKKEGNNKLAERLKRIIDGAEVGSNWKQNMKYSQNSDNIGNLRNKKLVGITSPPYAHDSVVSPTNKSALVKDKFNNIPYSDETIDFESRRDKKSGRFLPHPFKNIGRLKDNIIGITSPPYAGQLTDEGGNQQINQVKNRPHPYTKDKEDRTQIGNFTRNEWGNLNNQQPSYLSEMMKVYQEAYKSGMSVLCTITKNPTRNKKLRRLDLNTAFLLEKSGWKIIDYHRAILFKTAEQKTLFGETQKVYKGRLSFFKLLSLKRGNVASNFEDIIIAVRKKN